MREQNVFENSVVPGTDETEEPGGGAQPARFLVELIKPSHYDDEGYVIQWWRGWIASNSLSRLYGLAIDAKSRRVLGADAEIEIDAHDETNSVLPLRWIVRRFRRNHLCGLVFLVGVQGLINFPAQWIWPGFCGATGLPS